MRRLLCRTAADRGAAAVEFALLLPLLLLLIFGIIDFGRALNAQITLTEAAREGARLEAVGQYTDVTPGTIAAASGLNLAPANVTITSACPAGAGAGVNAVITVTYSFSYDTPIGAIAGLFGSNFSSPMSMSATGVMPCET